MRYYIMRGGIIINDYADYAPAAEAAKSYPGAIILKECYTENRYGVPVIDALIPNLDNNLDEDYEQES